MLWLYEDEIFDILFILLNILLWKHFFYPSKLLASFFMHYCTLFQSKPKEVKKTKTAPINKSGAAPPALVITPPVSGESSSLMKLPVSPGGPEYVKSLTTSMTLDRRNGSRKKNEHQPPGKTCACPLQNVGVPLLPPKGHVRKDKQRVKSAPLSSGDGGLASTVKKKSSGPSFSKIAILSSFFERRAAQEAGTIAPQRPHQRLLPWMAVTRDRKYAGFACP